MSIEGDLKVVMELGREADTVCEGLGLWRMELFTDTGKWKYTAYIQMDKPKRWTDFLPHINAAMDSTPPSIRGVRMSVIPAGWTGVMFESPWGFPIQVKGI